MAEFIISAFVILCAILSLTYALTMFRSTASGITFKGTKHKIMIDGVEKIITYERLIERAQKGWAAELRFAQADRRLKKAMEIEARNKKSAETGKQNG